MGLVPSFVVDMKITYIYSTLALLILEASAQASGSCDDGIIDIKMAGDHDQSYTLSIPQDGTTVKISLSPSLP